MSGEADYLNNIAKRVRAGKLDAGPRASFDEYNGEGSWAAAKEDDRKMERATFAAALRAIAKSVA